jgi:ComF family protein
MSYFLDMIYPRTCSLCGHTGLYLCLSCRQSLNHKGIHLPKNSRLEGHLSLFRYKGLIKSAISDLKFKFVSDIINEISDLVVYSLVNHYPHLLRYWQENNFVFVPIPLHPYRQLWRGYNQSELLATKISQELNMTSNENLITRLKNTPPQSLIKDRRLRHQSLNTTFSCATTAPPLNIILFDDVYTSGSTLNSAASILPDSCHLWGLSLAG